MPQLSSGWALENTSKQQDAVEEQGENLYSQHGHSVGVRETICVAFLERLPVMEEHVQRRCFKIAFILSSCKDVSWLNDVWRLSVMLIDRDGYSLIRCMSTYRAMFMMGPLWPAQQCVPFATWKGGLRAGMYRALHLTPAQRQYRGQPWPLPSKPTTQLI